MPSGLNAQRHEFYVSPQGAGSECTAALPCDLSTAKRAVEAAEPSMTGDLTVELSGGTYVLESPLSFTPADSGLHGHKIIFRAAAGQVPVLSGGLTIKGWTLQDAKANLWQASVPKGFVARQMYVNGVVAQLARRDASVLGGYVQTGTGYILGNGALATWSRPADVDFVYPAGGAANQGAQGVWTDSLCAVASVSGNRVTMQSPCFANAADTSFHPRISVPTYVENNQALLGNPGEFYIDSGAGLIDYVPRPGEELPVATVVAPRLEALLRVEGAPRNPVHDLQISGLSFEYASWIPSPANGQVPLQSNALQEGSSAAHQVAPMPSAVQFHGARRIDFSGNTLEHLGGGALSFDGGGSGNRVIGNRITDVAGNGITIGATPWPTATPPAVLESGYLINDNYVYNVANRYQGGNGIFASFVRDTTIDHNEVWDVPYTGISLGWGWGFQKPTGMTGNHVDDNYVHDVMTSALFDGGGIYVNGTQHGWFTSSTIENNVVDGVYQPGGAIYLDNGSCRWRVRNNVVTHAPGASWLRINHGDHNTVESNFSSGDTGYDFASPYDSSNALQGNHTRLTAWPPAAQAIIATAGLEPGYRGLLNGPQQANLSIGAGASASSAYDRDSVPQKAIDLKASTGWQPAANDTAAWVQIDLGAPHALTDIQLLMRQDLDRLESRRDFSIRVSDASDFSAATTVCTQGGIALPYRATLDCAVPGGNWRYVRIAATAANPLYLAEVRVYGAAR